MTTGSQTRRPIEPFLPRVKERPWGTETIIGETSDYLGKILHYQSGCAGGFQLHRRKDETFYLVEGRALVESVDDENRIVGTEMHPGMSYHIPPGAPHRFLALEDCVVLEVSTPVHEDRVRLEEEYGVEVIGDAYGLETTPA